MAATIKAQAFEKAQFEFRLGQKVRHKKFGIYFSSLPPLFFIQMLLVIWIWQNGWVGKQVKTIILDAAQAILS